MEMSKTFGQIKAYAKRQNIPMIPIAAKDVSILREPFTFYETLLAKIQNAKNRVALSALYIGTGQKEEALLRSLNDSLERNPKLRVNISLDANRATRVDLSGKSSVSTLQGILTHETARLNLVQTRNPSGIVQQLLSRFQKWNELSSTYHSKLLVFDQDVIITGANLSSIYFERRRDRYMTISKSKLLSDYIYEFLADLDAKKGQPLDETIETHNNRCISDIASLADHDTDCYILPMFQFGPHAINTCDDFLKFLEDALQGQAKLHLSSGYFNPTLRTKFSSVLVPSEEANGFYNGSGLLRFVPRLYTALMKKYLDSNPACNFHLYKKPGWSYHAKGLWVEGLDDICIHMIGSSNFNSRSSERDFELQFLIVTANSDLNHSLLAERADLLRDTVQVEPKGEWNLNPLYKLAARLLKTLL